MLKKTAAIAALAGATLLSTTPALADGYRHGYGHGPKRVVVVQKHFPHYAHHRGGFQRPVAAHRPVFAHRSVIVHRPVYAARPVVVHRPVYAPRPVVVHRPVVVQHRYRGHDVLGGLIVGAVLGAVIASHGGY